MRLSEEIPARAATLVVVSYYDARPDRALRRLLVSMRAHPAGADYDVVVVANSETGRAARVGADIPVLARANRGMNIGAWEHGWRSAPAHTNFLFLQDDCLVHRTNWLGAFLDASAPTGVGLIGESLNAAWDKPWTQLARERAGEIMPDHLLNGAPSDRVTLYLDCMKRWGVDPGATGRHLRSLIWFARRDALEAVGGFPIGDTYGECIAAEIAVSRKMEATGLAVAQAEAAPFAYISHADWTRAKPGGPYLHTKSRKQSTWARVKSAFARR